jgi:hypothetical protein
VVLHRWLVCTCHGVVQVVGGGGCLCFQCLILFGRDFVCLCVCVSGGGILSGCFIMLSGGGRSCVCERSAMSNDCVELVNLCFCRYRNT